MAREETLADVAAEGYRKEEFALMVVCAAVAAEPELEIGELLHRPFWNLPVRRGSDASTDRVPILYDLDLEIAVRELRSLGLAELQDGRFTLTAAGERLATAA